jgi:hypothetical protein
MADIFCFVLIQYISSLPSPSSHVVYDVYYLNMIFRNEKQMVNEYHLVLVVQCYVPCLFIAHLS